MKRSSKDVGTGAATRPVAPKLRKLMVPWEESGPEHEPLFVNHFQILRDGTDVYIDAGLVPIDDIFTTPPETGEPPRFFVLQRLAMSANTFADFYRSATEVFKKLAKEDQHSA